MKYLWLAVTTDKYEFPICVEESASRLALKLGTTTNNICSLVSKGRNGTRTDRKIIRVPDPDYEEVT